jgi:hypothetical protein
MISPSTSLTPIPPRCSLSQKNLAATEIRTIFDSTTHSIVNYEDKSKLIPLSFPEFAKKLKKVAKDAMKNQRRGNLGSA